MDFDDELMERIAEGLLLNPFLSQVQVTDQDEQELMLLWGDGFEPSDEVDGAFRPNLHLQFSEPIYYDNGNGQDLIGQLRLRVDLRPLKERILHLALMNFTIQLIAISLMVIIMYFILKNLIIHPMQNVSDYFVNEKRDGPLIIEGLPKFYKNEFSILQDHVNNMIDKIRSYTDELEMKIQARTQQLKAKNEEMDLILRNIDQGLITFNLDLILNNEHSEMAKTLFLSDDFNGKSVDKILSMSEQEKTTFETWLNTIQKPSKLKRWRKYLMLNPCKEMVQTVEGQQRMCPWTTSPLYVTIFCIVSWSWLRILRIFARQKSKPWRASGSKSYRGSVFWRFRITIAMR